MSSRRFDYVVFDLDGTLLDTRAGIIAAAIYIMDKYKMPIPTRDVLEGIIGPPIQESFCKLFDLSDEKAIEMANAFRDVYISEEYLLNAVPYEGIFDLFDSLKKSGVTIGIATYKREDLAKQLLCKEGFDKYTEYIFGSDFEGKLKKSDIILTCLDNMGCKDYSKAVYIGDGKSDGTGAITVGIVFLAVTYGFGFKTIEEAQKFDPIGVADSCTGIREIILGQN